jgi:pimeloyl-ACP methyl ester carboxylesterase
MDYKKMTREDLIAEARKENPRWSTAEIEPWSISKTQFDPAIFTNMNFKQPSYTELVPQIRCPALLITADQGIVTPKIAQHAVQLSKTQKPFQWVHIKDSSHNIRREQFEQFWKALNDFLAEC